MSLGDALQHEIDEELKRKVYKRTQDIVELIKSSNDCDSIVLNVYIAFREVFHGGWVLWLGNEDIQNLTPAQKARLPLASNEVKAKHLFRLSVWSNGSAKPSHVTTIPDGAEIFVERVTKLMLFGVGTPKFDIAQGNTRRVEMVTRVEATESGASDNDDQEVKADHDGIQSTVSTNASQPSVSTDASQASAGTDDSQSSVIDDIKQFTVAADGKKHIERAQPKKFARATKKQRQ